MKRLMGLTLLLLFATINCNGQDFNRWTVEGGGGVSLPSGPTTNEWNTGWNVKAGGGFNFTSHISAMLEFDFSSLPLSYAALQNYGQLDGFTHFWSLSLDPRYDFNPQGNLDFYITGGYGLESRTLFFTDPTQDQEYCDPYSGFCSDTGAPVIASFTDYKGGANAGGGFSYAIGDSGVKFFVDGRYHKFMSNMNNQFITVTMGIKY